jgi:hypothetical protein
VHPPYSKGSTPKNASKSFDEHYLRVFYNLEGKIFKLWVTYGNRINEREDLGRRYKRIKVKGHYRDVIRDSDGRFKKVKKWSSKTKR